MRGTLYDYGDFGGMAGDRHLSYGTVPVCKLGSEMENYEETRQMDFAQVPAHHAASHHVLSPLAPKPSAEPTTAASTGCASNQDFTPHYPFHHMS